MVDRNNVGGHLSEVQSTLRKKIGQYGRRTYLYVGATSDPNETEERHRRRGYNRLITLWRTTSYDNAKKCERMPITFARTRGCLYEDQMEVAPGLDSEAEEYFIYVAA